MFTTLVSVALFVSLAIQGVLADFDVETPTLVQCKDVDIKWEDTKGPYSLVVVKSTDPCGDILADLGDPKDNSFKWKVNFPAGSKLMFSVEDNAGDEGWSKEMVVQSSSDSSCLPAQSQPSTTSNDPSSQTDTPPVPVGAANAGGLPGVTSSAPAMRQLSIPAMAITALVAAVATLAF